MQFEQEIIEYTKSIWSSMLDLSLESMPTPADHQSRENTLTGCIHISGAWQGAVAVQCPRDLARAVACIMFGLDDSELGGNEVEDALGEIANMLGGNLKTLMPSPAVLSLPVVIKGRDYAFRVPGAVPVNQTWFRCSPGEFSVTLFHHDLSGVQPRAIGA